MAFRKFGSLMRCGLPMPNLSMDPRVGPAAVSHHCCLHGASSCLPLILDVRRQQTAESTIRKAQMRHSQKLPRHTSAIGWSIIIATVLLNAKPASAQPDIPTRYRKSEYTFKAQSSNAEHNTADFDVEWSYPVFVNGGAKVRIALNTWLRELSLKSLAACSKVHLNGLLRMTDRKIVESLRHKKQLVECGLDQSVLIPINAVGRFMVVEHVTESIGLVKSHHDIQIYFFDTIAMTPINVASLFKPDALAALDDALNEEIRETRPECPGRHFDWSMVTVRPPSSVFITFPYNPAEWDACGDGVEMIEGQVVAEQLLDPSALIPERSIEKVE